MYSLIRRLEKNFSFKKNTHFIIYRPNHLKNIAILKPLVVHDFSTNQGKHSNESKRNKYLIAGGIAAIGCGIGWGLFQKYGTIRSY